MRKLFTGLMLTAALAGAPALAQDTGRTEREAREVTSGVFESPFLVSPQVGILGFADGAGDYSSRVMEGVTFQLNPSGMGAGAERLHYGLETGILFSHIGAPGAGFFGSSESGQPFTGANAWIIPANIVAGYQLNDKMLLAGHLGTDIIYRSTSAAMQLGRSDQDLSDSTEFFPALGLNLGYEVSKNLGISLRGDYIATPADDLFSASLGATFGLG